MSIYKSAVQKPITTMMIFLALFIFGIYSLVKLPVDFFPKLEFPAITIITTYSGANAEDIETNITKIIENSVNSIDNLKEISSVSRDNISVVTLEFEWETNLDEASNDIRNSLEFASSALPEDADEPIVFKFDMSMMPIMFLAVTADENYQGIEKILNDRIINPLNRVNGIGSIGMAGTPTREIYIDVDPLKLEAYNLSIDVVSRVVQMENLNVPAGSIKMGAMHYQFKTEGELTNSKEIENIVITNYKGQNVYVKDIASVTDSIKDISLINTINGKPGVRLFVQKQSDANTVKVAKDIRNKLEELKKNLPPDIHINTIFDSSTFINNSINNLSETLFFALIFVVFVVLFFLGRWRATFIVVITIPISLIVAFIYLGIAGGSINVITLASLSIAIGMVVDDAIVVLENITKHIERGSAPREAAIYATNEVWLAVIVTTLVVVAVFFPLTLVSGMTGVLFKPLGWIVTITVVTSTLVAISLTPMLSAKLLKLKPKSTKKFSYDNTIGRFLDKVDNFYERLIRYVLHKKITAIIVSTLLFIGTMMLVPSIGTEFIPEADESQIRVNIETQTGTRVEETDKIAKQIEKIIRKRYPEVTTLSVSSGADEDDAMSAMFMTSGSHIINIMIKLNDVKERDRSCWDIGEDLRHQLEGIPEISDYNVSFGGGGMGTSDNNKIDVEIYGFDFESTNKIAEDIAGKLKDLEGARNIQISRDKFKPELKINFDRDKLALYGLNTATVATQIRSIIAGSIVTKLREDGDEYNIKIRYKEDFRNTISDIENIRITNMQGNSIRVKDIGTIVETWQPPSIERKSRERVIKVSASPHNISLGDLASKIDNEISDIEIPQGTLVEISGAYKDQQESFADLGLLLLLSLILVYIVMASLYESFKIPLIIMFSIPFSFSGVVLGLYFTNTNLSVIAALGAVLLIGIVVKNAIVLVDFINLMRDRGYQLYDAIALSGRSRLRPVLMTAGTTILGMLPLAFSLGEGSEVWRPMGISVIGGLLFSTVLTLLIIPVMYAVLIRSGERRKARQAHLKEYTFMD